MKPKRSRGVCLLTLLLSACSPSVAESGSTGSTTSTGITLSCGDMSCAQGQLCVTPACRHVLGEECYLASPDGGAVCPPGTLRGEQFDLDCPQPGGYACVDGCPPPPPFCVDLPSGCDGVATCGCLTTDPCAKSNSGSCQDADIDGGVLSCSLSP